MRTMKSMHSVVLVSALMLPAFSYAVDLSQLSTKDANSGLKAALEQGANAAISKLGVADGFLNNEKVKMNEEVDYILINSRIQMLKNQFSQT